MVDASSNSTDGQLATRLDDLAANVDDIFLIFNAILVSLMQPGFACLEAGCVNSKNVTNIMMKNLMDMFICAICYWLVGYTLSYGEGNAFLGLSWWAGVGLPSTSAAHWFFQYIFAATAATIVSGAVAERCNFVAYIAYSSVISGLVYPVVVHWAWSDGGFLANLGYRDFAGSGVVHLLAGVSSLVAAICIGPRIGRFQDGVPVDKPGHSVPLLGLGGLLLVSGFLGFNGGSLGHISHAGDGAIVAKSVTNSILGGSGAGVVVLALSRTGLLGPPTWAFSITLNSILTGIVSSCAGVDVLTSLGAMACGAVACLVYLLLRYLVIYFKVDDPLDAVAVHLGGGLWGVISVPLFAPGGVVYGVNEESISQLWHGVIGVIVISAWSGVCSVILFGILRYTGYLRVTEEKELEGLDISMHGEPAYPVKGWATTYPINIHSHQTSFQKHGSYTLDKSVASAFDNPAMELDYVERQR